MGECILQFGGGGGKPLDIFNFPLSIQPNQPTAKAVGHIWVKMDAARAARITHIVLDDAVRLNYTNGYMILKVADVGTGNFHVTQDKKLTSGEKKGFELVNLSAPDAPWTAGYNKDISSFKLQNPAVWTNLDGTLGLEDAFQWNGAEWVTVSQKKSFFAASPSGSPTFSPCIWNMLGDTFIPNSITSDTSTTAYNPSILTFSFDGNLCCTMKSNPSSIVLYRINGNVFTEMTSPTLPAGTTTLTGAKFSPKGNLLILSSGVEGGNSRYFTYLIENGSVKPTYNQLINTSSIPGVISFHPSGKYVFLSDGAYYGGNRLYQIKDDGTLLYLRSFKDQYNSYVYFSPDGTKIFLKHGNGNSGDGNISVYNFDFDLGTWSIFQSVINTTVLRVDTDAPCGIGISKNCEYVVSGLKIDKNQSAYGVQIFKLSNGKYSEFQQITYAEESTPEVPYPQWALGFSFTHDGKYLAISHWSNLISIWKFTGAKFERISNLFGKSSSSRFPCIEFFPLNYQ